MKFTTVAGLSSTGDSAQPLLLHAPRQRECRHQRCRLVRPDAGNLLQLIHRRQRQRVQRAEFLQQIFADPDDVCALQAGAQQNGDQLRVSERVRPARHEPFARTLAGGLVFEPQAF